MQLSEHLSSRGAICRLDYFLETPGLRPISAIYKNCLDRVIQRTSSSRLFANANIRHHQKIVPPQYVRPHVWVLSKP